MSWDVFVQDIPNYANSVDQIADDFEPRPVGTRSSILAAIVRVAPFADVSDPSWVRVERQDLDVEVDLGDSDPVSGFAVHVRQGDAGVWFVAALLAELRLRAFDPGSDTGLFEFDTGGRSLAQWRAYREAVVGREQR